MTGSLPKLIVILDDHPITTQGLKSICEVAGWNAKVEAFSDDNDFFSFVADSTPDLFLIDIQLKNKDGREVVKQIKSERPNAKVIVLSSFEEPDIIRSAYAAGADAYIIKNATFDEMLNGIKSIWNGEKFMQKQVRDAITDADGYKLKHRKINIPRLTSREKEILLLIVEEKTSKEIAETLFLSEKTIETHRSNLFLKMEVKNLAGIVRKAVEWGMLK